MLPEEVFMEILELLDGGGGGGGGVPLVGMAAMSPSVTLDFSMIGSAEWRR